MTPPVSESQRGRLDLCQASHQPDGSSGGRAGLRMQSRGCRNYKPVRSCLHFYLYLGLENRSKNHGLL